MQLLHDIDQLWKLWSLFIGICGIALMCVVFPMAIYVIAHYTWLFLKETAINIYRRGE